MERQVARIGLVVYLVAMVLPFLPFAYGDVSLRPSLASAPFHGGFAPLASPQKRHPAAPAGGIPPRAPRRASRDMPAKDRWGPIPVAIMLFFTALPGLFYTLGSLLRAEGPAPPSGEPTSQAGREIGTDDVISVRKFLGILLAPLVCAIAAWSRHWPKVLFVSMALSVAGGVLFAAANLRRMNTDLWRE